MEQILQEQESKTASSVTEEEISAHLEQYRAAIKEVERLCGIVQEGFDNLPTLEDKFKFVLDLGSEFLQEDNHYCPHELCLEDGSEICLYDDFFWEKYETKDISDFFAEMYYSFVNKHEYVEHSVMMQFMIDNHVEVLNHDNKHAVLVRDMLSEGIGRATHNW